MASAKSKLLGIILIIVGAFPLLMNISSFSTTINEYSWATYVQAGQFVYQGIIIVIGIFLLLEFRSRQGYPPYPYPPRR